MSKVSIITVNYNQTEHTLHLLDSLRLQSYSDTEIIVVDNGSKESPEEIINTRYPQVKVIRSEKNLGFAGGNNLGINHSTGEYLFFVNNDTVIPEGCIDSLVYRLDHHKEAGIVCPLIYYYDQPTVVQFAGYTPLNPYTCRNESVGFGQQLSRSNKLAASSYAHGAAMMVRRSVVEQVGLMSEDYFLYYEELDWGERIRKAGFGIFIDHNAHIYHKESMSVGKASAMKTYFQTRNRILFVRKHFNITGKLTFALFMFLFSVPKNIFTYLITGNISNLKSFLAGIFWHVSNDSQYGLIGYKYNYLRN